MCCTLRLRGKVHDSDERTWSHKARVRFRWVSDNICVGWKCVGYPKSFDFDAHGQMLRHELAIILDGRVRVVVVADDNTPYRRKLG